MASASKKPRDSTWTELSNNNQASPSSASQGGLGSRQQAVDCSSASLFTLPDEVLEMVLSYCDSKALARVQATCSGFRALARGGKVRQMSMADKAAMEAVLKRCRGNRKVAERWKGYSWIQRLRIEETITGYDQQLCESQGFHFENEMVKGLRVARIKLEGVGPKMLVSSISTADTDFLHWHLELLGNQAVEFGVIPLEMQDEPKSLHKCLQSKGDKANLGRPAGVSSNITVGSMLPVRLPIMKGTYIEILAWQDRLEFLIKHPQEGMEMTWSEQQVTVPKPYKGPREFSLQMGVDIPGPLKLAVTCWAKAEFRAASVGVTPTIRQPSQQPQAPVLQPYALPMAIPPLPPIPAAAAAAQEQALAATAAAAVPAPVAAEAEAAQPVAAEVAAQQL